MQNPTLEDSYQIIYPYAEIDNNDLVDNNRYTSDPDPAPIITLQVNRKPRITMTFDKLKTIHNMISNNENVKSISLATGLSLSAVRENINKIDICKNNDQDIKSILKKLGRRKNSENSEASLILPQIVQDDNSLTQKGIINKMVEMGLPRLNQPSISRLLKKNKITRKRLKRKPASNFTPELINKRKQFAREMNQIQNGRVVYLDESGFNLHTGVNYGYSPINMDAIRSVPNNRGRNVSLIALFSINGIIAHKSINGAYNTNELLSFLTYAFDQNIIFNDNIIILDNARIHHSNDVRLWCDEKGIILKYLPPYSPSLNPIEQIFALIKSRYSEIRPAPSTNDHIHEYIDTVINQINIDDHILFENYYNNMRKYVDLAYNGQQI